MCFELHALEESDERGRLDHGTRVRDCHGSSTEEEEEEEQRRETFKVYEGSKEKNRERGFVRIIYTSVEI